MLLPEVSTGAALCPITNAFLFKVLVGKEPLPIAKELIVFEVLALFDISILWSIVVNPFKSIAGVDPETTNEPVMEALPFLEPSHSVAGRLVKPEASPTNEPEKIEPDIAVELVKSTTELETVNEPVITASPLKGKLFKQISWY